jgi:flagellar assembly protein FliH
MSSKSVAPANGAGISAEPFVFAPATGERTGRSAWPSSGNPASASDPEAEQKGYAKGLAEGESRARASFEQSLTSLRVELSETLRQFDIQRESYFQRVERDVVQLALSIARKILHREAQIDPLLLTAIVRVALDTLNEGTQVRLRTNPQEIPSWRDHFNQTGNLSPVPELIGDASLDAGCCVLETDLGNTHISLEAQLKEVEQGFLDLLEQRPRVPE